MTVHCRAVALPEAGGRRRSDAVVSDAVASDPSRDLAHTNARRVIGRMPGGAVPPPGGMPGETREATADAPMRQRLSSAKIKHGSTTRPPGEAAA